MSPLERQNYVNVDAVARPAQPAAACAVAGDAVSIDLILAGQRIFGGLRFVAPRSTPRRWFPRRSSPSGDWRTSWSATWAARARADGSVSSTG